MPFYERSTIVNASTSTVVKTLAEGSILVLVDPHLFLRSIRGAMVVIIALPLSLLLTFIVMRYAGLNANLMSLGGLAISIGMIIDATIIQVENVQRHLSSDRGPGEARDRPEGGAGGAEAQHLRRAHHRPDLHPDHHPGGHGGQDVLAAGLHRGAWRCSSSLLLSIFVIPVCLPGAAEDRAARKASSSTLARRAVPAAAGLRAATTRCVVLAVVAVVAGQRPACSCSRVWAPSSSPSWMRAPSTWMSS